MKKIMFMLLITTGLFADGFYSTGYFGYDWVFNEFNTSVLVGVEYHGLYAEGEQNTYMTKSSLYMFSPHKAEYYARAGFRFNMVFVEYEHLCIHGIDINLNPDGHGRVSIGFDTRQNDKNKDPRIRRNSNN